VFFTPAALGVRTASLYIYNNTTNVLTVSLGGTAVSPSTTTLASSVNPSVLGQNITFTAKVSSSSSVPTGSVTFKNSNTALATVTMDTSGTATYTTSTLPFGFQTINAVYSGDANFATSKGTLKQGVKLPTTVTLTSTPNPSTYGQSVTFNANVSSSAGGTPPGSVTFKKGTATIGTSSLDASGNCSLITSATALSGGVSSITAVYAGNSSYITSTSPVLKQTVSRTPFVQHADGFVASGTSTSVAFSYSTTAGNLITVTVAYRLTAATINTPTDSQGNLYATCGAQVSGPGNVGVAVYYAKNIPGGVDTVTTTVNLAGTYIDTEINEWSGRNKVSPCDTSAGASGTTGSSGGVITGASITTSAGSELILGSGVASHAFTAAGTGFTNIFITSSGDITEYKNVTSKGSYTATATVDANAQNWALITSGFK